MGEEPYGLARWLRDLREGGMVAVGAAVDAEAEGAAAELETMAIEDRARGPDGLPRTMDLRAALAAAQGLHRAAMALAHPERDAEVLLGVGLPETLPAARTRPDAIHSVDLTFRHLPRLWTLARAASADAAVERLEAWASAWPLSGVGMPVAFDRAAVGAILGQAALRVVFLERIMAGQVPGWDDDPDVGPALRRVRPSADRGP